MKLWKIERTDFIDWDQYDGFVIRAETQERALELARKGNAGWGEKNSRAIQIEVDGLEEIILDSFNAG